MGRTYNVIDADGHVLEPVDLWDTYIDPAYRDRAPRLFVDSEGKERLRVEGKVLGSPKGLGLIGAIGARQGSVSDATMKYFEGSTGCFAPHGCTARTMRPSGPRWRRPTSRSVCTKGPAAACPRSASTGSRSAGRGTSAPIPWR